MVCDSHSPEGAGGGRRRRGARGRLRTCAVPGRRAQAAEPPDPDPDKVVPGRVDEAAGVAAVVVPGPVQHAGHGIVPPVIGSADVEKVGLEIRHELRACRGWCPAEGRMAHHSYC